MVDDDPDVRAAIGLLLRSAGFATETFRSAYEFLGGRRSNDVACLILDIRMPLMDGLTLQDRLAALGSTMPIVFITADDGGSAEERARAGGALAFLRKPFDDEALLGAVRHALSGEASPQSFL